MKKVQFEGYWNAVQSISILSICCSKSLDNHFSSCENMQIAIEKFTRVLAHLCAFLFSMDPDLNWGKNGLGMALNTINFVFKQNRYLQPPSQWITCALESRELLAICLKKLKQGLSKVTLIMTIIAMEHWLSVILECLDFFLPSAFLL